MSKFNINIKFIDASNWHSLDWYSTGGTRAKKLLQDENGNEYYFKCSEKKPARNGKQEKHYKFEFWNEIIAYQLGKHLGLDMLQYDVAIFNNEIGCISPKMTKTDEEQLLDIGRFMTAINPNFLPEYISSRTEYTFQLLETTLNNFQIHNFWKTIFETLLFDVIISNTDRHQENWAFIGKTSYYTDFLKNTEINKNAFKKVNWSIRRFYKRFFEYKKNRINIKDKQLVLELINIEKFAPIFDSGSSMARELTEKKLEFYLENENELLKYIENGRAELHWENKKVSHFQLIKELLASSYQEEIIKAAVFLENWDNDLINCILNVIDKDVPNQFSQYRIPENRKHLISKLLTLRFSKLNDLVKNARI